MNMLEAAGLFRRAALFGFNMEGDHTIEEWAERAQEYLYEKGIERRPNLQPSAAPPPPSPPHE